MVKNWLTWNDVEARKKVNVYGIMEIPLVKNDVKRLHNIASTTTRSFEIIYDDSQANFLVSSRKQHDSQLVK